MRFKFIADYQGNLPINRLCAIMNVSSRGYRAYRSRPLSQSQCKDLVVSAHIREQFALSLGSYGRPRMTEELKEAGIDVGHRRVGRLMKDNGIRVERSKKYKGKEDQKTIWGIVFPTAQIATTASISRQTSWAATSTQPHPTKNGPVPLGTFPSEIPCRSADISYIWTREGWLYLAVIIDLYSRRVVGWAVSNRMKRDLAIRALEMAITLRRPSPGCIHHTDRGSQYCSHDYQKILRRHKFKVSMSGKGNCYDNAAVETFFKTIKAELIWRHQWPTRRAAELAIFEYINGFYNARRKHSALGWKSPLAFEAKAA